MVVHWGVNVQRRKRLISVFFSICSLHPVSWQLLHREPTFITKQACEGTLYLRCLFFHTTTIGSTIRRKR